MILLTVDSPSGGGEDVIVTLAMQRPEPANDTVKKSPSQFAELLVEVFARKVDSIRDSNNAGPRGGWRMGTEPLSRTNLSRAASEDMAPVVTGERLNLLERSFQFINFRLSVGLFACCALVLFKVVLICNGLMRRVLA